MMARMATKEAIKGDAYSTADKLTDLGIGVGTSAIAGLASLIPGAGEVAGEVAEGTAEAGGAIAEGGSGAGSLAGEAAEELGGELSRDLGAASTARRSRER